MGSRSAAGSSFAGGGGGGGLQHGYMAAPGADSVPTRTVVIGNQVNQWPCALFDHLPVFLHTVGRDAWDSLSPQMQAYLKRLLPARWVESEAQCERLLAMLFDPSANFFFGHPFKIFHAKLTEDAFNYIRPSDRVRLRDNARVLHDHQIRRHYMQLLKRLLTSRSRLLRSANVKRADEKFTLAETTGDDPYRVLCRTARLCRLKQRAVKRARVMLGEIKHYVGEPDAPSSDDEDMGQMSSKLSTQCDGRSTLSHNRFRDVQMHQPVLAADARQLLVEHLALKDTDPAHPSLGSDSITFDQVLQRANMTAAAAKMNCK